MSSALERGDGLATTSILQAQDVDGDFDHLPVTAARHFVDLACACSEAECEQ